MNSLKYILFLLVLLLGLTPVHAQDTSARRFEPTVCPFQFLSRYNVECGYLTVPEEHTNPDGASIRVMLAIFRTDSPNPQPDPIVFLAGGPGSNTLDSFATGLGDFLNNELEYRDVILVDQRGMGYSEPSLDCGEVDALSLAAAQGPYTETLPLIAEAAHACYERLSSEGINISAYTTVESAADIADIAPALGYESINLYAGSYGTTLAFTVIRHHAERLRSVFMLGITPPQIDLMASFPVNLENSLNLLFETCAADTVCSSAYPNLETIFHETVSDLNDNPLLVTVNHPLTGTPTIYAVNGYDFVLGIQQGLYNWWVIPQLPLMIMATYSRNIEAIEPLVALELLRGEKVSEGAYYAMRCTDDVMTTTPEIWEAALVSVHPSLQGAFRGDIELWSQICADWGVRQLDAVENTPVTSDVPTLIMNGAFDPVTPARWAVLAVETLPNSFSFDFAASGHGVAPSMCALSLLHEFYTDPTQALNGECTSSLPPVAFVTP